MSYADELVVQGLAVAIAGAKSSTPATLHPFWPLPSGRQ